MVASGAGCDAAIAAGLEDVLDDKGEEGVHVDAV